MYYLLLIGMGCGRVNLTRNNGQARSHQTTTLVLMLWLKKESVKKFSSVLEDKKNILLADNLTTFIF